ncbi:MAG: ArsC/Spx/MgsR family protein [Pseudomonadota bacterium]
MSLTLTGLKNCDTCKKAMKALTEAGLKPSFVDIRTEADLKTLVPQWLEAVGSDLLINKRSTTWRNLSEDERNAGPSALLQAHPTLIKRPVIETGKTIYVGWTKDVQAALLEA